MLIFWLLHRMLIFRILLLLLTNEAQYFYKAHNITETLHFVKQHHSQHFDVELPASELPTASAYLWGVNILVETYKDCSKNKTKHPEQLAEKKTLLISIQRKKLKKRKFTTGVWCDMFNGII